VVDIAQCNELFHQIQPAEPSDTNCTSTVAVSELEKVDGPPLQQLDLLRIKQVLVNAIHKELKIRFGTEQRAVYAAAASLASSSYTFDELSPLVVAAKKAGGEIDEEMLSHEIPIAMAIFKNTVTNSNGSRLTTAAAARLLHPPSTENLLKVYRFAMTMALDTAKAERSFSTVKRLQTDNRRSMTEERMSQLVVLAHEKKMLTEIQIEQFIDKFRRTTRRLIV